MAAMINLKRVYLPPAGSDGARVLVERLWPRGLRKSEARVDAWFRNLAPSPPLRRWFAHRPERWPQFRRLYQCELQFADRGEWDALLTLCRDRPVTFIFAARDTRRNGAAVLRDVVMAHSTRPPLTSSTSPLT